MLRWLRRLALLVLALLLLGTVAWWSLRVPYRPGRVFDALPADAICVTAHHNLAGRAAEVVASAPVASLLQTLGAEPSSVADALQRPEVQRALPWLCSDDTVTALAVQKDGSLAWTACSWVGNRSLQLRWLLGHGRLPGVSRVDEADHTVVWRVALPESPGPQHYLTLALDEGVLMLCYSPDPFGAAIMLETAHGRRPGWGDLHADSARRLAVLPGKGVPDRAWLAPDAAHGMILAFRELGPKRLQGFACWKGRGVDPLPVNPAFPPQLEGEIPLLPMVVLRADADRLLDALQGKLSASDLDLARSLTGAAEGMLACSIYDGDLSGRLSGFRIPGLLLGLPIADPADARGALDRALDLLNARWALGLVQREMLVDGRPMILVEGTAGGSYDRLPLESRVTAAIVDGWLLVASHPRLLSAVLAPGPRRWPAEAGWLLQPDASHSGWLWADLPRAVQMGRAALAAYSLQMLMDNPAGTQEQRQQLNEAKAWLDALAPLETLQADWQRGTLDRNVVRFHFGHGREGVTTDITEEPRP